MNASEAPDISGPDTLHLSVKKRWFDMIASGIKREEYRDATPYWKARIRPDKMPPKQVHLTNGYGHHRPRILLRCLDIKCREGKPEWGGLSGKSYIVIMLGEVLHRWNMPNTKSE